MNELTLNYLIIFFQLTTQMVYKKAFLDYSEADIAFSPTYKYDPGTDEWDSR